MYKMNTITRMLLSTVVSMTVSICYSQKIVEFDAYVQSNNSPEDARIVELLTRVQPTVYLERGAEKVVGNTGPTVLIADVQSVNSISTVLNKTKSIELIEVRIKNQSDINLLNLNSDLISLSGSLKAFLIRSEVALSDGEFKALFKVFKNSNSVLLYQVSIPN